MMKAKGMGLTMPTQCVCKLSDCAYFTVAPPRPAAPGQPHGNCDCLHADKPDYLHNPCPLYRKEWLEKQGDKLAELKNRLLRKKL